MTTGENHSQLVICNFFVSENMEEAIEIAKANPMFEDAEGTIEVREIKQMDGIN